ncbi:MAG TPA: phage terminase large subunit, partial [Acidimicrobiia bacterium]
YSNGHQGVGVRKINLLGGRSEALRFLGTVRPHRLLANWLKMGGAESLGMMSILDQVPVVDVEPLGPREVVALATSTGTLVANGYAHHNSQSWSVRVRTLVSSFGPRLFGIGLNKSQANIANWRTTLGFGGMLAAGIGGGITGNPGQLIVIDDVIKNMEEAGSPTTKRKHLDEWDGAISARFQEDTKVLITATRWAEDDLSGEIFARTLADEYAGIPVQQIRIKAVAEPDEDEDLAMNPLQHEQWRDFLGRRIGEHLQGQHSAKFFAEKQASVSPYVWSALYQASPSARKGSMFPLANWGWYDPDDRCNMAALRRVWDIAATEDGGDWSVGALVGRGIDNYFYVLDVRRFQKSTSGVKKEILRIARADSRSIPIRMEQERAGAGKSTIANYAEDLAGWDFDGIRAEGEKVSRFMPYADLQQTGRVRLPRRKDGTSPDWVQPFVDEHKVQMPDGRGPRHDDQIDTVAYAINELYTAGPWELADPYETNPDAYEQILDIAADHEVLVSPELPDRLASILGR